MKPQSTATGKHVPSKRLPRARQKRRAAFIVWCAFFLFIMVGMTGLVIDGGMSMATFRHAHNAADAAAMAAAYDLYRGKTVEQAVATGEVFGTTRNNISGATAAVTIPPATGPYAGDSHYAEVEVTVPMQSYFIHVLPGFEASEVSARAVAGYEDHPFGIGIITLDAGANPGFLVSGNGTVTVYGGANINSEGGGLDENGNAVNSPLGGNAVQLGGNSVLKSDSDFNVVGGVNDPSKIQSLTPGGESPLHANASPAPDPFAFVPAPTTANDSTNVTATTFNNTVISGTTVTLQPGVYVNGISISGKANVTFAPGVYVLAGGGMQVSGQANVTAHDVMFYNTGHDYNVNTGFPDSSDGNPTNSQFGPLTFSGQGRLDFAALDDSNSPFHGMLFYQRRANTQPFTVSGNSTYRSFAGMIYAKSALLAVSGNGGMDARAVVGRFSASGNGTVTLGNTGDTVPKVREVFLVE